MKIKIHTGKDFASSGRIRDFVAASFSILPLFLVACTHVTNVPLEVFDPEGTTAYRYVPRPDQDTLSVATFSGGGKRAAALSYGALETLAALPAPGGGTLLDHLDIVSSVSGGSVTAAWYALNGPSAVLNSSADNAMRRFLYHDWTLALVWRTLNPLALVRYGITRYSRSDMLADFYAEHLLGNADYGDVQKKYAAERSVPYLMLNATDVGHQIGFPFTQGRFDLICSDLTKYRLADAVAASSNFPLAFSATGLQNYSPCPAQRSLIWKGAGPRQWVAHYERFNDPREPAPSAFQVGQLRQARMAKQLLSPADGDRYIHLLDGGLIDNLGIRSTLAIEDDPARVPGLYLRIGPTRPNGYERVQRILYFAVNARTRDTADVDRSKFAPGIVAIIEKMITVQLSNAILTDEDYLIAELEAAGSTAIDPAKPPTTRGPFLSDKPTAMARIPAANAASKVRLYLVAVDFDMIPDPSCRAYFWSMKTNWALANSDVDALRRMAAVLISRSPGLKLYYQETGGTAPPELDFTKACEVATK